MERGTMVARERERKISEAGIRIEREMEKERQKH